ncbi:MAG: hypothetical protein ACXWUG_10320 [Polyangiales bacterium]
MAGYASVAIVEPARSDYRSAIEALGYDRRTTRQAYAIEGGTLFRLASRFALGPFARVQLNRLGPPYAGVDPIDIYAFSISARAELTAVLFPRIFFWAEPTIGAAAFVSTGNTTVGSWGGRGGIGLAGPLSKWFALRLRLGYAWEPSMKPVTAYAGKIDFGGYVFALDGVFGEAP